MKIENSDILFEGETSVTEKMILKKKPTAFEC